MSTSEVAKEVMELPEKERLELARQIIASVAAEQQISEKIAQDIVKGVMRGMTEAEFREALR